MVEVVNDGSDVPSAIEGVNVASTNDGFTVGRNRGVFPIGVGMYVGALVIEVVGTLVVGWLEGIIVSPVVGLRVGIIVLDKVGDIVFTTGGCDDGIKVVGRIDVGGSVVGMGIVIVGKVVFAYDGPFEGAPDGPNEGTAVVFVGSGKNIDKQYAHID